MGMARTNRRWKVRASKRMRIWREWQAARWERIDRENREAETYYDYYQRESYARERWA